MASASSSSAKNLFSDSKRRLAERVAVNVNNASSVARQIVRGSKSNEILMQAAKNFAYHESTVDNSIQNLKKMEIIFQHLNYQYEAIQQAADKLEYVEEQVNAMERWYGSGGHGVDGERGYYWWWMTMTRNDCRRSSLFW